MVFQEAAEKIGFPERAFFSPIFHCFVSWYQSKNLQEPLIEIKSSLWVNLDNLSRSFRTCEMEGFSHSQLIWPADLHSLHQTIK